MTFDGFNDPDAPGGLRARAEKTLREAPVKIADPTIDDARLLHELQVHQVELEMQNEELRRAHIELGQARDRYAELFDSAPVGYVTLDDNAVVVETNQAAAALLGVRAVDLKGRRITDFIARSSQDDFHRHRQAMHDVRSHVCELNMHSAAGSAMAVCLHSTRRDSDDGVACFTALVDISDHRRSQALADRLIGELSHRLKNTLATVQAIGMRMGEHHDSVEGFLDAFRPRLQAMSRAHALLSSAPVEAVELRSVLQRELEPYIAHEPDRVELIGGRLLLSPEVAVVIHLVVHELTTNAVKHGALSTGGRSLAVTWEVHGPVDARVARLTWAERGGPGVEGLDTGDGFGMDLVRLCVQHDLDGGLRVTPGPDGIRMTIEFPYRLHVGVGVGAGGKPEPAPKPVTASSAAPRPEDVRALAGKRILVVEDQSMPAMYVVRLLRDLLCEVAGPVGTVEAAMRLASNDRLDGVLLDLNLQGRSSLAVAEELQRRGIPIVLMSGYDPSHIPSELQELIQLRKPFDHGDLDRAMIEAFL